MHKDTHIYSVDNRCYEQHGHTQKTQLSSDNSPPLLHPPPCHHNSLFVLIQTRGKSLMLCSLIGHNSEASLMLDQWCYRRRGHITPSVQMTTHSCCGSLKDRADLWSWEQSERTVLFVFFTEHSSKQSWSVSRWCPSGLWVNLRQCFIYSKD